MGASGAVDREWCLRLREGVAQTYRGWLGACRPIEVRLLRSEGDSRAPTPQRSWMKLDQTYTTTEFRRDLAACTAGGAVNEECMKGKGWVSVTQPKD